MSVPLRKDKLQDELTTADLAQSKRPPRTRGGAAQSSAFRFCRNRERRDSFFQHSQYGRYRRSPIPE
jgi:hypothetical protein